MEKTPVAMPPSRPDLSGTKGQETDPETEPDPALGDPLGLEARRLALAGDLDELEKYYRRSQGDQRTMLLEAVAKHLPASDQLEAWALRSPDNAVAQVFGGANFCFRAYEARGGKLASGVGKGQWELFFTWLKEAAACLEKAISLDPADPEPYAQMIRVLLGDASLSERPYTWYFDAAVKQYPEHLFAHMDVLTQRCKKWGGSHEAMWAFARETSARAPEGSLLHLLIPQAIIERVVGYKIDGDYDTLDQFLYHPDTKEELMEAYYKSGGSERLKKTPLTPVLYNWFACALVYCHAPGGYREMLQAMGDSVCDRPWAYLRMPVYGHVNEVRKSYKLDPI